MNGSPVTYPIVGQTYRPPAKAILSTIAIGARLILRPEPENPFDSNAKAVLIRTEDLTMEAFAALDDGRLKIHNMTIQNIAQSLEWHLGYIPKTMNNFVLTGEVEGRFAVGSNGGPRIRLELQGAPQ